MPNRKHIKRGARGKRKNSEPSRPAELRTSRLLKAITRSNELNAEHITEAPGSSDSTSPGGLNQTSIYPDTGFFPVSIESDSDNALSPSEEIHTESSPFEEDKLVADPPTIVPPTELSLTTKTASDGRIISTISLKKF